jgi:putative flippase GtrA
VEFTAFTVIGVVGLGLTELLMYTGVDILGLHYLPTKLITVVIVFAWNFGMRRMLLFGRKATDGG